MVNMRNVAIIGKGYWGEIIKKYVYNFFNLKYYVDSKFDKTIIWDDPAVEAVIIATPIETHYDIAKMALEHGKHVYCAKPLTGDYMLSNKLYDLSVGYDKILAVDYTVTFSLAIKKMMELLPTLGSIGYIHGVTQKKSDRVRDDVYKTLAVHQLSLLSKFRKLDKVIIRKYDKVVTDGVCLEGVLCFNGGMIDVSLCNDDRKFSFSIYGENGYMVYNPLDIMSLVCYIYHTGEKSMFTFCEKDNVRYSLQYFSDLLEGSGESNIDTAICIDKILNI